MMPPQTAPPPERRCRVLYLLPALVLGGAERVVVEHLRRLPRDRFAPELAAFGVSGGSRALVPADVPVHQLRGPGLSRLLARRRALRALILERQIEVVSSHLAAASVVLLAEAAGSPSRAARLVTVHGDPRGSSMGWRRRLGQGILRRLAPRAHRIVFLCRETADAAARSYGARGDQVAVIPNGVDPGELQARSEAGAPLAWPAPGLRLIAIGRLETQKGFDILLPALASARGQGVEASLLILGEGAQRAALERLRARLGLDAAVSMPGHQANLYPTLRHADLFLLPSRFEGFPLVLLEALALGRPALAAACPAGPAELLANGAGMLVPPNDPAALAAALIDLARSPERRALLGARGRARADDYPWSSVIASTSELLLAAAAASAPF
ncbi:MAG: glycosyltransferase [Planctomycetaceae bacterium]